MPPTKRKTTRVRRTRKTTDTVAKEVSPQESVETVAQNTVKPNNLLILLLIFVAFFAGYIFGKANTNKNSGTTTGTTQNAQQDASAPLSDENLKKDAQSLGLDMNKFNQCFNANSTKQYITADTNQAGSLGVQGTPGFFINGQFLGGAFPYENFDEIIKKQLDGTASGSCKDYSQSLQQYCKEDGSQPFNPVAKNIDLGQAPVRGKSDAKVTIVEYSDFQCPFCQRAYPTVKKILETYPNDVKLYYKEFPLVQIHPYAQHAAQAGVCAQQQGKFWQMHDKMFESQGAGQTS